MKKTLIFLTWVVAALAVALVAAPAVIIRPFVAQSPTGLKVSYWLRAISPWATLLLGCMGGLAQGILWHKGMTKWGKIGSSLAVMLLLTLAILSRQNHFEWSFHPVAQVGYTNAANAKHVKPEDMILGVKIGDAAKAYPVLMLAYHHVVNTEAGGEPLVVTY